MGTTRDFRQELAHVRCWDAEVERAHRTPPHLMPDAVLQNREELIGLCEWIAANDIRSYLEIGCWTGRLAELLHGLFRFEKIAACDLGLLQAIGFPSGLPPACRTYWGSSHSAGFRLWREKLGAIDLVMIDGDHTYEGVKKDFEVNAKRPHRFLAFHDISGNNPGTLGVKQFWDELRGNKTEIVRPHVELGLPHSTMGIGIWSRT